MPVRTAVLVLEERSFPEGSSVVGTTPAGQVWLVKEVILQQVTEGLASFELLVRRGTRVVSVLQVQPAEFGRVYTTTGRSLVTEPGDSLEIFKGGTGPTGLRVGVFGARLVT